MNDQVLTGTGPTGIWSRNQQPDCPANPFETFKSVNIARDTSQMEKAVFQQISFCLNVATEMCLPQSPKTWMSHSVLIFIVCLLHTADAQLVISCQTTRPTTIRSACDVFKLNEHPKFCSCCRRLLQNRVSQRQWSREHCCWCVKELTLRRHTHKMMSWSASAFGWCKSKIIHKPFWCSVAHSSWYRQWRHLWHP